MNDFGPWIVGALMGALALLGLVLASRAVDTGFALFGWALTFFGLAVIMALISKSGAPPSEERRP